MGKLLTKHHEGGVVEVDGSGGNSQSRQGAGTGTSVPRVRVFGGGGAQMRFWRYGRRLFGFQVRSEFIGEEATRKGGRGDAVGPTHGLGWAAAGCLLEAMGPSRTCPSGSRCLLAK